MRLNVIKIYYIVSKYKTYKIWVFLVQLGIGGIKININVPGQISKEDAKVADKFTLTTKSEQEIVSMKVSLIEQFTTGRGDNKETKNFTLGSQSFNDTFSIKTGENKDYNFDFGFVFSQSRSDTLKEKGGALGAIGSMGKFANNEKSAYLVAVSVDVKSVVLDPSEELDVKLV